MAQFKYIVVNKENRQLSGLVDAPEDQTARQELQDLGFSIISLEKVEAHKGAEEEIGMLFEFSGIDAHNRNIAGTIRGESRYEAFKRLMAEYQLDVKYIIQNNLNEKEKEEQKKAGIFDLMKIYQEEVKKMTNLFHEKKIKNIDRAFEKEKALLMRQVDYVLKKVNSAVDEFGEALEPQDKQTIITYVNKILRLKSSTNLEYLRNSCTSLLEFIQKTEINVKKQEFIDKKMELLAETQNLINSIQKHKDFTVTDDLEDKLLRWRKDNVQNAEKLTASIKIQDFFVSYLIKIIHQDPELRTQKKELSKINNQLRQYYTLLIKSPKPTDKVEIQKTIKKLKSSKKILKSNIKTLKKRTAKEQIIAGDLNIFQKTLDFINGLTGWLLFFYLVFYFIAGITISKQVPYINDVPSVFYIFQTGSIKYLLPVIFLLHAATSLKLNLFRKNIFSDFVIFPLFVIFSLLVVFNF
ncbi:hypothetical protein JW911_02310 [Candidatus Peregrinibacteria bacterium]|nr:hypothetical protein [Candidatus Peregrinibacteria bacterium]